MGRFADLTTLLAKATPARSGDELAGIAAASAEERIAAQIELADTPLRRFLNEPVVPYESDAVTRLILDSHDASAFAPVAHLSVGEFREFLLSDQTTGDHLARLEPGVTPEMAAAVSKIMRVQDLVIVAAKRRVVTRFRDTIGLPGRLSTRLQPNHPTDDPRGSRRQRWSTVCSCASSGDAVIGDESRLRPCLQLSKTLLRLLDRVRQIVSRFPRRPASSRTSPRSSRRLERRMRPVDLVFQSIAGTEAANRAFGIEPGDCWMRPGAAARERQAGDGLRGPKWPQALPGAITSCISRPDRAAPSRPTPIMASTSKRCEARAYAVARRYRPLLVNTVVGFIGPEYLYDGKQIIRAGLEDHFCGKAAGPTHGLRRLLHQSRRSRPGRYGCAAHPARRRRRATTSWASPAPTTSCCNYQSTSFHDALYLRSLLKLRPAPEFEAWLERMGILDDGVRLRATRALPPAFEDAIQSIT
jgi:ethanolamine ammonia-lyase large subunit